MSPKIYRTLAQSAVALACAFGAVAPAPAQDGAAQRTVARWRPTEGTYASPGKGFVETCGEFGDLAIALRKKTVSGHEWGCKVNKLSDTNSDAIRIDMTCSDLNLAEDLKKPEDAQFREVILLKKIDGNSMSVRKTVDGKFKDPEWKAVYCPEKAQQMYRDAEATSKAEPERK